MAANEGIHCILVKSSYPVIYAGKPMNGVIASDCPQQVCQSVARLILLVLIAFAYIPSGRAEKTTAENSPSVSVQTVTLPMEEAYTLGSGDRIAIDIFQSPEYSTEQTIPVDGTISLPLVGQIYVEGKTIAQLTDTISGLYARILRRPLVTMRLISPRPVELSIAGEVNRPGPYTINVDIGGSGGTALRYPTLAELILQAGGITLTADVRQIQIRRVQHPGIEKIITVDLLDFLQNGDRSQNISLRDGDFVSVPTTTQSPLSETRQLGAGVLFIPEKPILIAVVGAVSRPGTYTLINRGEAIADSAASKPPTVTLAIQEAGGIKPTADIRNITLRRFTQSGQEQIIVLNLWQLLKAGDISQNAFLQDGDTVIVPEAPVINPAEVSLLSTATFSPDIMNVYVIGEVVQPGLVEVPPTTPLNQAILAAGGFERNRARRTVNLIRRNPDGTVKRHKIEVDFARSADEQLNPILYNNDVIVVRRSDFAHVTDFLDDLIGGSRALGLARLFQDFLGLLD